MDIKSLRLTDGKITTIQGDQVEVRIKRSLLDNKIPEYVCFTRDDIEKMARLIDFIAGGPNN